MVARLGKLLILCPDPFKGSPEGLRGWRSVSQELVEHNSQSPELDAHTDGKDQPGHQHPKRVLHQAIPALLFLHLFACFCFMASLPALEDLITRLRNLAQC